MHVRSVQNYCFCLSNIQICDVLVAVVVVIPYASYFHGRETLKFGIKRVYKSQVSGVAAVSSVRPSSEQTGEGWGGAPWRNLG